jgi:RNA polymerase sigma-70 factor (ECF subfamily)
MSPNARRTAFDDDADLIARLRSGDAAAYAEWVRRESPRLLAVTKRLLRDEDEAQDAVQEAFVSAWRALPNCDGNAKLSTWLHRIGVNAALMRLRSRRRRREDSIDQRLPGFADDGHHEAPIEAWTRSATCASEQREIRDVVRACIERLPESYREVLVLRDIEGLDTAETARALGTSPEALKMRLHRARQALRSELAPYMSAAPISASSRGSAGRAPAHRARPRPARVEAPRRGTSRIDSAVVTT